MDDEKKKEVLDALNDLAMRVSNDEVPMIAITFLHKDEENEGWGQLAWGMQTTTDAVTLSGALDLMRHDLLHQAVAHGETEYYLEMQKTS